MANLCWPLVMLIELLLCLAFGCAKATVVYPTKPCRNQLLSRSRANDAKQFSMSMLPWRLKDEDASNFETGRTAASPVPESRVRGDAKVVRAMTKQKSILHRLAGLPVAYAAVVATMSGTYLWLFKRLGQPLANHFGALVIDKYFNEFLDQISTSKIVDELMAAVFVEIFKRQKPTRPDLVADALKLAAASEFSGDVYLSIIPLSSWWTNAMVLNLRSDGNKRITVILLTEKLVNKLTTQELRAVIAHELGHSIHNDTDLQSHYRFLFNGIYLINQMGLSITSAADLMEASQRRRLTFGGIFIGGLGRRLRRAIGKTDDHIDATRKVGQDLVTAGEAASYMSLLIQRFISRDCEYAADAHAATLVGPHAMISALQKLEGNGDGDRTESPMPATGLKKHLVDLVKSAWKFYYCIVAGQKDEWTLTHPLTEKRIAALKAMEKEMHHYPMPITAATTATATATAPQLQQGTSIFTKHFMNALRFWFLPSE